MNQSEKDNSHIVQIDIDLISKVAPLFNQYRIFYGQASDLEGAEYFLKENITLKRSLIFLLEVNNIPAAFTQIYFQTSSVSMKRDFILNDLFVHQDFRNQGLAKSLMSFIMEFASRNSIRSINLETAPSNNAAQSLYDSLGWRSDKILNSDGYFKYTWAP